MATLTIRGLDQAVKSRLRVSAARHGRSMEAEARMIIGQALPPAQPVDGLGSRIHARFAAVGGAELELPRRHETPRVPRLKT